MTKCPDCLAHYSGKHECDGLMKMLVGEHKKGTPVCVQCGGALSEYELLNDVLDYCANPECPNYSLVAVRVSKR